MTIADVAAQAGVSVATVSRVLNKDPKVRPETRDRVMQAIRKLNYIPNMSARNLRRRESRVILVLARNFTHPFYAKVLAGISDTARAAGYSVLMCDNGDDPVRAEQQLNMLKNREVDGAVLLNCTMDDTWLRAYAGKYPLVQCCENVPGIETNRVCLDHFAMAYDATRYLISLGHRRIAIMSANNRYISTIQRCKGYIQAMTEAGLPVHEELCAVAGGDYSFQSGSRCASGLLSLPAPPTAIFCISDVLALSTLLAASEKGIRVPEQLSVIGCDDVDYTTMWHPFLTTVRLPCYEMGRRSTQLLLNAIQNQSACPETSDMEHSLIIRESTAPPAL